jgi:hypothetical protein
MTITGAVIKNIIRKLLTGEDYRDDLNALIDAEFLQYIIEFFGRVVDAKLKDRKVAMHLATDVNGDGSVDVLDLVSVTEMFENTPTAP